MIDFSLNSKLEQFSISVVKLGPNQLLTVNLKL